MSKCPKCGSELQTIDNSLQCPSCGSKFKLLKPYPKQESVANVESERQHEEMSDADKVKALEERIAILEADKYKRDHCFDKLKAVANSKAVTFAKSHWITILICTLLLIAFITLMVTLVGLRGIYVNVNDSNDFIDFTATSYRTYTTDFFTGKEQLEEGSWKIKGDKLILSIEDELFGKIEDDFDFEKLDGYKRISIDGDEYKRVSLVGIQATQQKVTVTFDPQNGSRPIVYKMKIGSIFDEDLPEVTNHNLDLLGWVTKDGDFGEDKVVGKRIWKDITLYASWPHYKIENDVLIEAYDIFGDFNCPRVSAIGRNAFANCYKLTSINIPDSVQSIGNIAFSNCTGLTKMFIPISVQSIGTLAMYDCTSLKDIYYAGNADQWEKISKGSYWGPHINYQMHFNATGMSEASAAIEEGNETATETIYVNKIAAPTLWVKKQRLAA